MSGVNERVQDTACAQSKLSTRDWNWELIIVSAVLIVFISLFMVHSSKEHSVCNRCTCESDLILKLTEKLTVVEKTIEELKVKEQVTRSGQPAPTYMYVPGPSVNIVKDYSRVSQSSEHSSSKYPASQAIDSNTNTFSHTGVENNPWWRLEFCSAMKIAKVTMKNRVDCCDDQMTNIVITVDDNVCGEVGGPIGIGKSIDIKCQKPLFGKVVKVLRKAQNTILSFSEIQIYSSTNVC